MRVISLHDLAGEVPGEADSKDKVKTGLKSVIKKLEQEPRRCSSVTGFKKCV